MQNGSIMRSTRLRGPDVWEFRWREAGADGKRKHRRMVIGSTAQFSDKSEVLLEQRPHLRAHQSEFHGGFSTERPQSL
jgi:hypothetical protein